MDGLIALEAVDSVEILTLVDNSSDLLLRGGDGVKRATFADGARIEAPLMLDRSLPRYLVAEHGFSALVTVTNGGRARRVLFDAGLSIDGLAHNFDVLQLDIADIEAIVLSHGHFDHIGGLNGMAKRFGKRRMPMVLHPDFWLQRRVAVPNQEPFEMFAPGRAGIEAAGFKIIEGARPSLLLDGSVLITGEVARTTEFERGMAAHQAKRDGAWTPDPLILDDQALVVHARDRGLVVLTGCGHAGIVNIVRHAMALTGVERLHAAIGGFHLSGPAFEACIAPTVAAMREHAPAMIVPGHCTGFAAVRALSDALPDATVLNAVGTRYFL
jgi:7,8-dihydropterin-6-yl-methyl-4-(beta-D-ribofuranosyl)aminobenzene 5'-phosphate synthase